MKDAAPDWFETCVAQLTGSGTLRVWSVLVTIFGDLAQKEKDQISGALISELTGLAGIKAEATRVALHRLRKEGWIESTRIGRNSVHRLTEYGRRQSAAATPRIYGRDLDAPDTWHLLIASSTDTSRKELSVIMQVGDYVSLNASTAMAAGPAPEGLEELFAVQDSTGTVPNWVRDICGPDALKTAYEQFWDTVQVVDRNLPSEGAGDPVKKAVLRVLIVHNWRRLVLRHPNLPDMFLPTGWKGAACREAVFGLLERLPRSTLETLEAELVA